MAMLDYRMAGESHGKALIALVEGMPAGVPVDVDLINGELARRQGGFGRSERMNIEEDTADILSGARDGVTIGSPVAIHISNRDARIEKARPVNRPRPGHADLAGSLKWLTTDWHRGDRLCGADSWSSRRRAAGRGPQTAPRSILSMGPPCDSASER